MDDSRLSTNILAQKRESLRSMLNAMRSMLNANTAPMISFVRSLLATTHTNCLSGRALSVFSPSYREPARCCCYFSASSTPPLQFQHRTIPLLRVLELCSSLTDVLRGSSFQVAHFTLVSHPVSGMQELLWPPRCLAFRVWRLHSATAQESAETNPCSCTAPPRLACQVLGGLRMATTTNHGEPVPRAQGGVSFRSGRRIINSYHVRNDKKKPNQPCLSHVLNKKAW